MADPTSTAAAIRHMLADTRARRRARRALPHVQQWRDHVLAADDDAVLAAVREHLAHTEHIKARDLSAIDMAHPELGLRAGGGAAGRGARQALRQQGC